MRVLQWSRQISTSDSVVMIKKSTLSVEFVIMLSPGGSRVSSVGVVALSVLLFMGARGELWVVEMAAIGVPAIDGP